MTLRNIFVAGFLSLVINTVSAASPALNQPEQAIAAGHEAIRNEAFLQAVNIFEQALLANPDHPAMHHHLGIAYYRGGHHDKALERLHNALELSPESAESHYALGVVHLARASRVSTLQMRGPVKSAIEHFESAITQAPHHAAAHYYLIQILLNAPAIAGGDKVRAEALNERLKELSPLYHQAVNSSVAALAEDYQSAEQLLLESHEAAPDSTLLNYSLLSHYYGLDQCEQALDFGQRFLAAPKDWDDSDPARAHLMLAECQQRLGNSQQSLQHYALALTYNKSEKVVQQVQAAVQELAEASD